MDGTLHPISFYEITTLGLDFSGFIGPLAFMILKRSHQGYNVPQDVKVKIECSVHIKRRPWVRYHR